MSSEEEIVKIQKILAASVILIALSLGIGGFEAFKTWYQIGVEDSSVSSSGTISDDNIEVIFSLDEISLEIDENTVYDGEPSSDSYTFEVDYGENSIYKESENMVKNVERGGYLVLGLILFVIWKLQEIKTESSEEIRNEIIEQINKVMKGTCALIAVISLYFLFGGAMEEDFDGWFIGTSESDEYGDSYWNFFGVDCESGWIDKPKFEWMGDSKVKYDDSGCPDVYLSYAGEAKIESSLKIGFFSFVGSLAPLYFVFSSISLNPNLGSFSVPSVPDIQNQRQDMKLKSPFKENEVDTYKRNNQTVYNQPEMSIMAIPEDEED